MLSSCPLTLISTCCTLAVVFSWVMAISVATLLCISTATAPEHLVDLFFYTRIRSYTAALRLESLFHGYKEICASTSNCSLFSRSRCPLPRTNELNEWLSGTDSRRDPGSTVPCSFVTRHRGRTLKEQLLCVILLLFTQWSPLAIHPLTAARACSAVSSLHPVNHYHEHCKDISSCSWLCLHLMVSLGTRLLWLKSTLWVVKA